MTGSVADLARNRTGRVQDRQDGRRAGRVQDRQGAWITRCRTDKIHGQQCRGQVGLMDSQVQDRQNTWLARCKTESVHS